MKRKRIKIEGPSSKTSFDFPSELLDRLDAACRERRIFRNAAVIESIEEWIRKPEALPPRAPEALNREAPPTRTIGQDNLPFITPGEAQWVRDFLEVLRSPVFGEPIKKNVEGFLKGIAAFVRVAELEAAAGGSQDNPDAAADYSDEGGTEKLSRLAEESRRVLERTGAPKKVIRKTKR